MCQFNKRQYRVLWSTTRADWVVVPETATTVCNGVAGGKDDDAVDYPHSAQPQLEASLSSRSRLNALISLLLAGAPVFANADGLSGVSVVYGSATVTIGSQASTVNQTSDKAIIDWQKFSINQGQSLTFTQPSSSAIALNRVTGTDPSQINGLLSANGQVWLLNPNGVMVGKTGEINVGGFLASTMAISNADFIQGKYHFSTPGSGIVSNLGSITAKSGYAVLAGTQVVNDGLVQANLGQVVLAAGNAMTLDMAGDKLLSFAVTQPLSSLPSDGKAAIENTGRLVAQGGRVVMTARAAADMMQSVINTTGVVEANSARMVNGEIVLDGGSSGMVNVAGTLDVSGKAAGETGGTIKLHGDTIVVNESAKLDARGDAGGGNIYVGGGWQGELIDGRNPSLRVAIMPTASLDVSAINSGHGGTIVAWSDILNPLSKTLALGSFKSEGGASSGDGGRVETSGYGLRVDGIRVSAKANNGKYGQWLLDPGDIVVSDTPSQGQSVAYGRYGIFDATDSVNIWSADLVESLRNNDVMLLASAGNGYAGTITFRGATIDAFSSQTQSSALKSLALIADGDVIFEKSVDRKTTIGLSGSLMINSKNGSIKISDTNIYTKNVLMLAGGTFPTSPQAGQTDEQSLNALTLSGGAQSTIGLKLVDIYVSGNVALKSSGDISVDASAGSSSIPLGINSKGNFFASSTLGSIRVSESTLHAADPNSQVGKFLVLQANKNIDIQGSILDGQVDHITADGTLSMSSETGYIKVHNYALSGLGEQVDGPSVTILAGGKFNQSTQTSGRPFTFSSTCNDACFLELTNTHVDAVSSLQSGAALFLGAAKYITIQNGLSYPSYYYQTTSGSTSTTPVINKAAMLGSMGGAILVVAKDGDVQLKSDNSTGSKIKLVPKESAPLIIIAGGDLDFSKLGNGDIDFSKTLTDSIVKGTNSQRSLVVDSGVEISADIKIAAVTGSAPSNFTVIKIPTSSSVSDSITSTVQNLGVSATVASTLENGLKNESATTLALVNDVLGTGGAAAANSLAKVLELTGSAGGSFQEVVTKKATESLAAIQPAPQPPAPAPAASPVAQPAQPAPAGGNKAKSADAGGDTPDGPAQPSASAPAPAPSNAPAPAPAPNAAAPAPASTPQQPAPAPNAAAPAPPPAPNAATGGPPPPPPVAPPPPSPVAAEKPPTPKDTADSGDKTLAVAAPPPPPKPPTQARAPATQTVAVSPVVSTQVPLPPRPPAGAAADQRVPAAGNSARW